MNKQQVKELALSNGFKLKQQPSGEMDLNPYVYKFAEDLLAKANERVRELEQENSVAMSDNEKLAHKILPEHIARRCYEVIGGVAKPITDKQLNKFAIEKKIEAYKLVLNEYGRSMHPDHKSSLGFLIEQLRKEQEHG